MTGKNASFSFFAFSFQFCRHNSAEVVKTTCSECKLKDVLISLMLLFAFAIIFCRFVKLTDIQVGLDQKKSKKIAMSTERDYNHIL